MSIKDIDLEKINQGKGTNHKCKVIFKKHIFISTSMHRHLNSTLMLIFVTEITVRTWLESIREEFFEKICYVYLIELLVSHNW